MVLTCQVSSKAGAKTQFSRLSVQHSSPPSMPPDNPSSPMALLSEAPALLPDNWGLNYFPHARKLGLISGSPYFLPLKTCLVQCRGQLGLFFRIDWDPQCAPRRREVAWVNGWVNPGVQIPSPVSFGGNITQWLGNEAVETAPRFKY